MINEILLEAIDADFDLDAIRGELVRSGHAVVDPHDARQYLLASDDDVRERALAERRGDPRRISRSVAIVLPTARRIAINVPGSDPMPARRFVEWLRARQAFRVLDHDFNDFTDQSTDLDFIFGPEAA
ncbi:MAG TPA: hypothetical protein VFQ53_37625 [Kofleriaceae bacterium]|nr:hypothetical protein [Kofleriaceae bacterium]